MRKLFTICCLLLFLGSLHAQRPGNVGIGAQFGQPTGLTLKIARPSGVALDFLMAWDLDDFFFLNVHGLWERPLSAPLYWFVGPGAFVGLRDYDGRGRGNGYDDFALGISGTIGLNAYFDPFEIFLQLTPRLEIIEETDGAVGGGLGFRFWF